jgi:hypothetical protein
MQTRARARSTLSVDRTSNATAVVRRVRSIFSVTLIRCPELAELISSVELFMERTEVA